MPAAFIRSEKTETMLLTVLRKKPHGAGAHALGISFASVIVTPPVDLRAAAATT